LLRKLYLHHAVLREEWRDEATVRRACNLPLPGEGDVELEEEAAA
jgi:hypothetical protein